MEDKSNLYIIGIVGIVAIIGIAIMVISGENRNTYDYESVAYDSSGQVIAPISTTTRTATTTTSAVDYTPRIAYWYGKVNQHVNIATGRWETDPDGRSGATIDMLTYCKKWYPRTTSVTAYKMELIYGWRNAGNTGYYNSTKQSYKCVQGNTTSTNATSTNCYDSDGGKYIYVKGYVKTSPLSNNAVSFNDICVNKVYYGPGVGTDGYQYETTASCTGVRCYVSEWVCATGTTSTFEACPNGCSDGACLKFSMNTCYDSDGGKNGNVSGYVVFNNYTVRDSCSDYRTVSEAICNNYTELEWWPIACARNCTAGRCI